MGPGPSKRALLEMAVVGVIGSILGIALGLAIDWFPAQASTQAGPIDRLWDVLVILSVPVFVGVTVVVLFSAKEFRMRPGQENDDGPPIHGNTKLEVIWTTVPAVVLVALCSYAYVVLRDIEDAPANAAQEMHVGVVGEQFAWTFSYPTPGGKPVMTSQLYLPEGASVKFDVRSKDVIHDFWVPAFRLKIDAVPGVTTSYRVTPNRIGDYPIVCAELCGLGHAFMRQTAHVLPRDRFDAWMKEVRAEGAGAGSTAGGAGTAASKEAGGTSGGGELASADGKTIFTKGNAAGATACSSCHTLGDAGATAKTGPNLDKALAADDDAAIRRSIVDPGAEIASGYGDGIMPTNFKDVLSPAELDALVSYLAKVTHK
jgi:cytochrome c oxidase subunit 2